MIIIDYFLMQSFLPYFQLFVRSNLCWIKFEILGKNKLYLIIHIILCIIFHIVHLYGITSYKLIFHFLSLLFYGTFLKDISVEIIKSECIVSISHIIAAIDIVQILNMYGYSSICVHYIP